MNCCVSWSCSLPLRLNWHCRRTWWSPTTPSSRQPPSRPLSCERLLALSGQQEGPSSSPHINLWTPHPDHLSTEGGPASCVQCPYYDSLRVRSGWCQTVPQRALRCVWEVLPWQRSHWGSQDYGAWPDNMFLLNLLNLNRGEHWTVYPLIDLNYRGFSAQCKDNTSHVYGCPIRTASVSGLVSISPYTWSVWICCSAGQQRKCCVVLDWWWGLACLQCLYGGESYGIQCHDWPQIRRLIFFSNSCGLNNWHQLRLTLSKPQ